MLPGRGDLVGIDGAGGGGGDVIGASLRDRAALPR